MNLAARHELPAALDQLDHLQFLLHETERRDWPNWSNLHTRCIPWLGCAQRFERRIGRSLNKCFTCKGGKT